ncbi:hypothetical protein BU24DRAFT_497614 [Aaosphaeria arxii CBS 175.79]|uniref:Protein kinase domain-containing protein n=1 Tax=Aaosphaeria arxii CBS 175.79 TaxID=1450172 RepID=A0A6A5X807_9PLEO|nr:uncharacterized protein BU24DRAFT_497614 [Aaosphaeria arxii CBS 175.79]KAF2009060.1 hypothetical protein BU24DRAFT_497614 [Aaosphaeria arxii CBS 175.79]
MDIDQTSEESHHEVESIQEAVARCRLELELCVKSVKLNEKHWADNRLSDFNLWDAGVGASDKYSRSLDFRLRNDSAARNVVIGTIQILLAWVKESRNLGISEERNEGYSVEKDSVNIQGKETASHTLPDQAPHYDEESRSPRGSSSSSDRPNTDANDSDEITIEESKLSVEQLLASLIDIGIAIRKAGTVSRLRNADDIFEKYKSMYSSFEKDLEEHLGLLNRIATIAGRGRKNTDGQNTTLELCIESKMIKPSDQLTPTTAEQNTLITHNMQRRHRFVVQRSRRKGRPDKLPSSTVMPSSELPEQEHTTEASHDTASGGSQPSKPVIPADIFESRPSEEPKAVSEHSGSNFNKVSEYEPQAPLEKMVEDLQIAASATAIALRMRHPKPPKLQGGDAFTCPYCLQTLSSHHTEKRRWKEHLSQDLQPYSCYLANCSLKNPFFQTFKSWKSHALSSHEVSKGWMCAFCDYETGLQDDFFTHIKSLHEIDEKSLESLNTACQVFDRSSLEKCAICLMDAKSWQVCKAGISGFDGNARSFLEHIGNCLHRFSLHALPARSDITSEADSGDAAASRSINSIDRLSTPELESLPRLKDRGLESISIFSEEESLRRMQAWITLLQRADNRLINLPTEPIDTSLTTTHMSLADQIYASFVLGSHLEDIPKRFLPASLVTKMVSEDVIDSEINKFPEPNDYPHGLLSRWIYMNAPKVFMICIASRFNDQELFLAMEHFRLHGFRDDRLPIQEPIEGRINLEDFPPVIWSIQMIDRFYEMQWRFLSPIFDPSVFMYDLPNDCILPFISKKNVAETGDYAIQRVIVHPDHWTHDETNDIMLTRTRILRDQLESEVNAVWEHEAMTLQSVNAIAHPNITKCIAAIRKGRNRYFMSPWADGGSLREYWESVPKQHPTEDGIADMVEQLRGLADALEQLHNLDNVWHRTQDIQGYIDDEDEMLIVPIRHYIVCPERILRFVYRGSGMGTLKISMEFPEKNIKLADGLYSMRSPFRHSIYAPPVPEGSLGFTRSDDPWAMGCIILEFIIWTLYGNEAVTNFESQLHEETGMFKPFFEAPSDGEPGVPLGRVTIHRTVLQWMAHIRNNDPECSRDSAIRDLLDLVQYRLLVIDTSPYHVSTREQHSRRTASPDSKETMTRYRATAVELRNSLDTISSKIVRSLELKTGYLVTHKSRANIRLPIPQDYIKHRLEVPSSSGMPYQQGESVTSRELDADYSLPPLKEWQYIIDNSFVEDYILSSANSRERFSKYKLSKLCSRCSKLDFMDGGFLLTDRMQTLRDRASECNLCLLLLDEASTRQITDPEWIVFERRGSGIYYENEPIPSFSVFQKPERRLPLQFIQIGSPVLPRERSHAFYDTCRGWLDDCDNNHDCHAHEQGRLPTRLIDVGTDSRDAVLRLIETKEENVASAKYFALSFAWGSTTAGAHFLTLRNDTSGKHHDIASFKKGIPYYGLPATLKDAVDFTRKLGVRYLWIDSICIIQGTDGDFIEEAKHMENVFSQAYAVLSVCHGTSQHAGFLNPRPEAPYVTIPGQLERQFFVSKNIDDFSKDVLGSPLNQRGWTLQERALAQRTIYFTGNQMYFECGQGVRCETLTKMQSNMADFLGDPRFPEKAMRTQSRALKVAYFQDLYRLYSRLQFVRWEDRPLAIAGLEVRLQKALDCDISFGVFLPKDDKYIELFYRSILWQRGEGDQDSLFMSAIDTRTPVPSWSWMAYTGGIDYLDPPFGTAKWLDDQLQPRTFNDGDHSSPSLSFRAKVRGFSVMGREEGVKIVYDTRRRRGSDGDRLQQCVAVAMEATQRDKWQRMFWVLVVAADSSYKVPHSEEFRDRAYRRVGVGTMPGKFIRLDEPGLSARIY